MFKKIILLFLVTILFSLKTWAHGVQIAWAIDPSSLYLRVYIEHWHGDLSNFATTSTIDLAVSVNGAAPIITNGVPPKGGIINTPIGSLPKLPGTTVQIINGGPKSNLYSDWGYWDVDLDDLNMCGFPMGTPISVNVTVSNPADVVFKASGINYPTSAVAIVPAPFCVKDTVELTTLEDNTLSFCDTDLTGQSLDNISILQNVINGTLTQTGNCFVYEPNPEYIGNDHSSFIVCLNGECDTMQVPIIVTPVTDTIYHSLLEGESFTVCDTNLNLITADTTSTCQEGNLGTHTISGNCITYTGNANMGGNDQTCYSVCNDGQCDQTIAIIFIDKIPDPYCVDTTLYLDNLGQLNITEQDITSLIDDNNLDSTWLSQNSFDCSHVGLNQITVTALDSSGQKDSCITRLTILDTIAPQITCQDITIHLNNTPLVSIVPDDIIVSSSDECGIDTIWLNKYDFICTDIGPNTVTIYIKDNNGNIDSCQSIVTLDAFIPNVDFSFINPCNGYPTTFNDQSATSPALINWEWNLGDLTTSSDTSPSHLYSDTGSYTVQLIGTTVSNCKDTIEKTVIVYNMPTADFTFENTCAGTAMTFNDTSQVTGNTTIVTFEWDFDNDNVTDNTTPHTTNTFGGPGQFPVSLIATTFNGCKDTITKTITVHPNPTISFVADTACQNTTTTFVPMHNIVTGTVDQLVWNYDDGDQDFGFTNIQHPFVNFGTHQVEVIAISNFSCSTSTTQPIFVEAIPIADFSVLDDCVYNELHYNNTSTIASNNALTYSWNLGDNSPFVNNPSFSYQYNQPNTYQVQLIATSDNTAACSDTIKKEVQVFARPFVDFVAGPVCFGLNSIYDNTTVFYGINIADSISEWKWDLFDDVSVDGQQINHTNTFNSPGNFPVRLTVITSNNCEGTILKNVMVYPLPDVNYHVEDACVNNITSFTNQSSIDNSFSNSTNNLWEWDYGDGSPREIAINPNHSYSTHDTYTTQLIVTSNYGCKDSANVDTDVFPNPEIDFTVSDSIACKKICPEFTNTSTIETGSIDHYEWEFNNGNATSTLTHPTTCFVNYDHIDSLNYTVLLKATSDKGCVSILEKEDIITLYPDPKADFSWNDSEPITIIDAEVNFHNYSIGGDQWTWGFGDGDSAFTYEPVNHYSDSGYYTITQIVTNRYNCKNRTSKTIFVSPEVIIHIPTAFSPNSDNTNDVFDVVRFGYNNIHMRIFDKWGDLIFENPTGTKWDGYANGERVKSDMYIYKIYTSDLFGEDKIYTGKVTVLY